MRKKYEGIYHKYKLKIGSFIRMMNILIANCKIRSDLYLNFPFKEIRNRAQI